MAGDCCSCDLPKFVTMQVVFQTSTEETITSSASFSKIRFFLLQGNDLINLGATLGLNHAVDIDDPKMKKKDLVET